MRPPRQPYMGIEFGLDHLEVLRAWPICEISVVHWIEPTYCQGDWECGQSLS